MWLPVLYFNHCTVWNYHTGWALWYNNTILKLQFSKFYETSQGIGGNFRKNMSHKKCLKLSLVNCSQTERNVSYFVAIILPADGLASVLGHLQPQRMLTHWGRDKNSRHFADDIFKRILLNKNVWISIKISLKFVRKGPINNIPELVQMMVWRRPVNKPLSEPMVVSLLTHICAIRPQWLNWGPYDL